MEARVFEDIRAAGFTDMTLAQARVFQRIGPRGTRLTDLADQARVTKQTAAALVEALERCGYVHRTSDPTDARARLVHIAERGLEVAGIAARTVTDVAKEWRAHLGARRYEQLRNTLLALRDIVDPYQ
ncbi:MarR family transcriptional regulator [Cryobacterium sp. 1639]|uniref:MarR family winged helix-turn-helix transcriptional regulator n=1 Tax=Cryobacterium inferilacus TaxID=2866629 RepID=UPI001C73BF0F|nr:MarR family transcriptional regulator [Cryobacterium sp. 1639]MBX0300468.1 MarR family transcriptional regulator [Cryobacterium sp. 1639]